MPSRTTFIESELDKTLIEIQLSCSLTRQEKVESPGIIIAHPYGPLGGSMNNNVVIALQRYFLSEGYVTVCINFRGCGNSKGKTSWTGMPERKDYISVMNYMLQLNDINYPSGYSFGGMIANTIDYTDAIRTVPIAYLLISIPLGVIWALATVKAAFFKRKPLLEGNDVLCVYGDRDQFTRLSTFENWSNYKGVCIKGADHFWVGYESLLVEQVDSWKRRLNI